MDPREYVKIKRIATGDPRDSCVLPRAVVFRRNVAHRRMASSRGASRIVLLAGALEYQRGESPAAPRLSSMDALLDQEHEHLRAAVARVCDLAPDVLCVERTVARFAQELLLERGVSVVLRVKTSALRRLARSTGASIAAAVDELTENAVGVCGEFRVESHAETRELGEEGEGEDAGGGGGGVKTLMTFDKCPAVGLGCSVLLKGASARELGVVKTALRDAIVWAHHAEREGAWLAAFATAAADDDDDDATSEWPPPQPQSRAVAIRRVLFSHWSPYDRVRVVNADP
jgi:1-phosphatidylinositol-3-phosphate 5-kinase